MRRHRQTLLVTTLVLVFVTLWWMMSDSNDKMNAAGIDVSNQINFKVFNSDRGTWETRRPTSELNGVPDYRTNGFTLLTWNVWFGSTGLTARVTNILEIVQHYSPTVVCFQEVTFRFIELIKNDEFFANNYHFSDDGTQQTFSRYGVLLLWKKALPVLNLQVIPFRATRMDRKLVVLHTAINGFTVRFASAHLESELQHKYERASQLGKSVELLRNGQSDVSLLCGDFNFCSTWPEENQNIPQDFRDLWPELHPNEPGWTEDTEINVMRFEMKNAHKQVRFDRVLLHEQPTSRCRVIPQFMELVGLDHVPGNEKLWPSDHFGLFTRFSVDC